MPGPYSKAAFEAIVIGSGPNGLCAAIELARNGRKVLVREAAPTVGGSARSAELTLPGFVHDVCSTVHALAVTSPMLRSLPLEEHGLELIHPPAPAAHPFDDGTAAVLERSVEATAATMGEDADAYRKLFGPLVRDWPKLVPQLLGPPTSVPRHPVALARFGLKAIRSATALADSWFKTQRARGLFAGIAAHSIIPLEWRGSAAFGLVLSASAHADGWPVAKGGSQKLSDALASYLRSLGGVIETDSPVKSLDALPPAEAVLCDLTPRQLVALAGDRLPEGYRKKLLQYRYGPAAFKLDWALSGPVPWKAAECARACTVHVAGTFEETADAERAPWEGRCAKKPFVLVVQPSLFDSTRAPAGQHVLWGYCHVPNGSTEDMTDRIESQIERFAPGFKSRILARSVMAPADLERHNSNLVGGDIVGGAQDLSQVFARPVASLNPYATPVKGLYLCSASTPPGAGVHGMCGYHAAQAALKRVLK